jgi:site-specific recombinase XerD
MRPPKVPEMLSTEQMKSLLADYAGKEFVPRRETAIVLMLADTGVRLSELTNRTLDDIDLRSRLGGAGGPRAAHHKRSSQVLPCGPT